VVAYDRLGFGRSDARHGPLTIDFVREEAETWFPLVREGLGIGEFIAMGHSVESAVEIMPGCRHVPHREAEGVVVARIARFLDA
jgi:pimeloyl-ACP methyl ester carboxylesterase